MVLAGLSVAATLALALGVRAAEPPQRRPADYRMVVALDVRQLKDAPLFKQWAPEGLTGLLSTMPSWVRLAEDLQVNPATDLDAILYARPGNLDTEHGLWFLRGTFEVEKSITRLERLAEKEPERIRLRPGKPIGRVVEISDGPRGSIAMAYAGPGLLVLAPTPKELAPVIEAPDTARLLLATLEQRAGPSDEAHRTLRVAIVPEDGWEKPIAGAPQVDAILASVRSLRGGASVTDQFTADFVFTMGNGGAATEGRKLLEGMKGLASIAAVGRKGPGTLLPDLVAAFKLSSNAAEIRIQATVTGKQIETSLRNPPVP